MHICIHMYLYVCIQTEIASACVYTCICTWVSGCRGARRTNTTLRTAVNHTYIHHTCTHSHTCMHVYAYICTKSPLLSSPLLSSLKSSLSKRFAAAISDRPSTAQPACRRVCMFDSSYPLYQHQKSLHSYNTYTHKLELYIYTEK
jgi:hypothetical protein